MLETISLEHRRSIDEGFSKEDVIEEAFESFCNAKVGEESQVNEI